MFLMAMRNGSERKEGTRKGGEALKINIPTVNKTHKNLKLKSYNKTH
jgi:hypothetical protein